MSKSLAIAYQMKRKAKKMADGGPVLPGAEDFVKGFKGATHNYAEGGHVKGVHKSYYDDGQGGESKVGALARNLDLKKGRKEMAMDEHHKILGEAASIKPKMQGLAEGGSVRCSNCGYMAEGGEVPGEAKAKHEGQMIEHEEMLEPEDKDLGEYHVDPNHKAMGKDDMVDRIMKSRMNMYSEGGKVANDVHPFKADFESPNEFDDLVLHDDLKSSYTGANSGDELGNASEDHDRSDIVARIMESRRKKDRNPKLA